MRQGISCAAEMLGSSAMKSTSRVRSQAGLAQPVLKLKATQERPLLIVGEEAIMADKSNFTPDEWQLLLESLLMSGIAVSAADPSGLWGLLKESLAGSSALAAAKTDPMTKPLIKAVVADFVTSQGRAVARDGMKEKLSGLKPPEIKAKCIETLGQVGAVLDAKAPDDAAAFKAWLRQISQHVAEAASEGGWFGLGGTQVSEAEKATLDEISGALRFGCMICRGSG
jgi:hypothetical protein